MEDVAMTQQLIDFQQQGWRLDLVLGKCWAVQTPAGHVLLDGNGHLWPHIDQAVSAALAEEEKGETNL